jgi:pimeloyl-ACP methyl ester carboxylesterase
MQVVVDGLLTNYSRQGSGKKILLLHGWGDSAKGMEALNKELAKKFEVLALDLPGFGGTQTPAQSWGLDDYADFVQAFLDKINYSVDILAGHSNGGAIAIRGLNRGLKAQRLVLIASAGIRGEHKGRMKALRIIAKTGKTVAKLLPKSTQKKLRRTMYTTVGSDMLVAEHLQETFKRVVEDDVRADAATLKLPTLLLYGDGDISTPLEYGQKLQDVIAGSELIVIPSGSHWLPTENTNQIAKYIKDFAA